MWKTKEYKNLFECYVFGWLDRNNLNVATTEALEGYHGKTSWWTVWTHSLLTESSGFRRESTDCIKNTLRDNVIHSWLKTDSLCQIIKISVNPEWQSNQFSPLLSSKMEVFCCSLNCVSRIFTHVCIRMHALSGTDKRASVYTYSILTEIQTTDSSLTQ